MRGIHLLWAALASSAIAQSATAEEATLLHWAGENWRVEQEDSTPASTIQQKPDGSLFIQAHKGMTIWLLRPLAGSYTLTLDRTLLPSAPACRVSDMNFFWAAHEPDSTLPRPRDGALASYNSLMLLYAGIGGNANTTTRFRWYDGSGARLLLQESTQPQDLLQAAHSYHFKLRVNKNTSTVLIDGKKVFAHTLPPGPAGYFGIRTVGSCQTLDHFTLHQE